MAAAVNELGPVDWLVVEFPGNRFVGEIAPALTELVAYGTIRVLDLVLLKKTADGSLKVYEVPDLGDGEVGQLRSYGRQIAWLLSEQDVRAAAEAVLSDSSAAVLVWENAWCAPFGSAVRQLGGQLVASGRITAQSLLAALDDGASGDGTDDRPVPAGRADRVGIVGPTPVARTATTVATASIVAHGVARRTGAR